MSHLFLSSPNLSYLILGLDFGDMADSSKICHKNVEYGLDEPSMVLRDLDGSLTGTPGVSVAAIAPYYQDGIDCELKSEWNMNICNGNFARVIMQSIQI